MEEDAPCTLTGYYSKTRESALGAANFTSSKVFDSLEELIQSSDTLFITTPDDIIRDVWDRIDKKLIRNKIICHFSGSLSSDVFSDALKFGAYPGSVHPMYAFSDRHLSYKQLHDVVFSIEGHEYFLQEISSLFTYCKNPVCVLAKENKVKYHTAASMASNHMLGLYDMCLSLLEDIGYKRSDACKVLIPLIKNNLLSALDFSVEQALTGPIERGIFLLLKNTSPVYRENKKIFMNCWKKCPEYCKKKKQQKLRRIWKGY
jgi:predicted short-subunit dehydrogenase-like oxidoreductase (DUF2520 family)